MGLNDAEEILVIFLSTALAVFLVVGIFALIKLVQVLNYLKSISEKADRIATNAESVSDMFKRGAGAAGLAKLLSGISEVVFRKGK